jgi:hypothetical protein
MLGKAQVAINEAVIPQNIIQSFRKTGLYPVSFNTFVENTSTLCDVPQEVKERTEAAAKERAANLRFKATNRRQTNINGCAFRVASSGGHDDLRFAGYGLLRSTARLSLLWIGSFDLLVNYASNFGLSICDGRHKNN